MIHRVCHFVICWIWPHYFVKAYHNITLPFVVIKYLYLNVNSDC